jgi:hypothetical protein
MTKVLTEQSRFKLLISADTVQYTRDYFPLLLFQSVRLRGREAYTDVYTIAAEPAMVVDGPHLASSSDVANLKPSSVAALPAVPAAAISTAAISTAAITPPQPSSQAQIAS